MIVWGDLPETARKHLLYHSKLATTPQVACSLSTIDGACKSDLAVAKIPDIAPFPKRQLRSLELKSDLIIKKRFPRDKGALLHLNQLHERTVCCDDNVCELLLQHVATAQKLL